MGRSLKLEHNDIVEKMERIALAEGIDLKSVKEGIESNMYCILSEMKVPLHEHATYDEIFYCIKGSGVIVVDDKELDISTGKSVIAPAGSIHTVRSDNNLILAAIMIPVNRIICHCKQVSYLDIRKAMVKGARTIDDIQKATGAGTGCGNCIGEIEKILSIACGCRMVTMDSVIKAVRSGAETIEKVGAITGATMDCGKCKPLIENIIDSKR